ncbi:MAG: GTPase HflX [Myxococcales bacterium]|nr:GTPase HflX [Myxococcales bacterium]
MSDKIHGNLQSLGAAQREGLARLYRFATGPGELCGAVLAERMCGLAARLNRQVGVLIDRRGRVQHVVLGDHDKLDLPDLGRHGQGRLRGLRLVHVHLKGEGISEDDLNDLTRLQLDLVAAFTVVGERTDEVHIAHIAPDQRAAPHRPTVPHTVQPAAAWQGFALDVDGLLKELEGELQRTKPVARLAAARAQALVIHVGPEPLPAAEDRLDEMEELCRTAQVEVVGRIIQRRPQPDPRTVIGAGKLGEIAFKAAQADADLLVFDQELSPGQAKSVSQQADMKVLDRTQLILDIFARRARSQDGKLQVELAQLRYSLPRLKDRDGALSRLTGGIGAIGPGETKLEVDKRRAKDRIHRIETELKRLQKGRAERRQERTRADVPTATLIGYTNVGKSSLLNALAKADIFTENLLFATLDPTSRRVRLPDGTMCVITDTVGFIRDLPDELKGAFEATLEEAHAADLLIAVIDASHAQAEAQHASVCRILSEHDLDEKPRLTVLNKGDAIVDEPMVRELQARTGGLLVSARTREGLVQWMQRIETDVLAARRLARDSDQVDAERAADAPQDWTPDAE